MDYNKSKANNTKKKAATEKKKIDRKKSRKAVLTIFVALAVFIGITYFAGGFDKLDYLIFYSKNFIDSSVIGDGNFPVSFTSNDIISAETVSSKVFVLTKKMLTCISPKGQVLFTHTFTFVEPQMEVSENYGIIFDRASSKYIIFNSRGIVFEGVTEGNRHIIAATVDKKGNCAIATKSDDSACRVYMIDKSGKILYIWACAEEYAISLDISADSENILCGAISAENNEVYTKIYNLDIDSAENIMEYTVNGSACVNVCYTGRNSAVVDCLDKRIVIDFNKNGTEYKDALFSGDTVYMDWDNSGNLAIITDKINSFDYNEITLYDKNNTVVFRSEVPENVISVLYASDEVHCLTADSIITFNDNGEIKDSFDCDIKGKGLIFVKNKLLYYSSGYVKKGF